MGKTESRRRPNTTRKTVRTYAMKTNTTTRSMRLYKAGSFFLELGLSLLALVLMRFPLLDVSAVRFLLGFPLPLSALFFDLARPNLVGNRKKKSLSCWKKSTTDRLVM
ncbi:unnamed protein product, partial [Amoebophrya sp. A25]|eukprot:GSA25T00027178001.1